MKLTERMYLRSSTIDLRYNCFCYKSGAEKVIVFDKRHDVS